VHSLVMPDGGDIERPRWTRDGKVIVFAHRVRDAEGFLHFDLYRWDFATLTRITHLADVRDADPLPDGRTAIAVRSRFGASQLVNVDLTTVRSRRAPRPRSTPSSRIRG
jgi:Tol biopolymer transport system component